MAIQSYLFFDGRCDEALEFYTRVLDAKVGMLMRFKDNPEPPKAGDPGCGPHMPDPDKVMHCEFRIGDTTLLASDGQCTGKPSFQGFSLVFNARNEADAKRVFAALGDGGQVQMPLAKTFFAPAFGMVADRFGLSWMVIVGQ